MNCSLCGLPKNTGAMASVLPQCICHWKHTPYQGTAQKELNDGGEPVKNATYWKRQYNLMANQNDNLKSGLYHANEQIKYLEGQLDIRTRELIGASFYEHDYKTLMEKPPLTDKEIEQIGKKEFGYWDSYNEELLDFARAILRKAQENE